MLIIYFSGTGNTKYVAELLSQEMNAKCFSIEDDIDFSAEIKSHDTISFCYPIYCSRVPHIMRVFVHEHMAELTGKKVAIFVTQQAFSGDGARVFTDLFEVDAIDVIYAEHFNMQQNMGNIPVWSAIFTPNEKTNLRYIKKTKAKVKIICHNIRSGIVKKRGFSKTSTLLGYIQGKPWQKHTNEVLPTRLEQKLAKGIRIHDECTACNLCVKICPAKNLVNTDGRIEQLNRCTVCYRCVNYCPHKAITVFIHRNPKWQYKGLDKI